MPSPSGMVVVLCNCPSTEVGRALAGGAVEGGLAACVNLLPGVRSVYVWEGEVCDEVEVTLLCKTAPEAVGGLSDFLRAHHPYDTPEIVVLPVDAEASDPRYVAWVRSLTVGGAP